METLTEQLLDHFKKSKYKGPTKAEYAGMLGCLPQEKYYVKKESNLIS